MSLITIPMSCFEHEQQMKLLRGESILVTLDRGGISGFAIYPPIKISVDGFWNEDSDKFTHIDPGLRARELELYKKMCDSHDTKLHNQAFNEWFPVSQEVVNLMCNPPKAQFKRAVQRNKDEQE